MPNRGTLLSALTLLLAVGACARTLGSAGRTAGSDTSTSGNMASLDYAGAASRHLLQGSSCAFTCASKCAACTSATRIENGANKTVTIDVSGCKNKQDLSWMCCKGATTDDGSSLSCQLKQGGCSASSSPTYEYSKNKCNTVQSSVYIVPMEATMLTVQVHDGKAGGTVNCGAAGANCCGGSGSSCAASGVCQWTIDLTKCPLTPGGSTGTGSGGCTSDAQCAHLDGPCAQPKCNADGTCSTVPKPSGTICRAVNGPCDVAETCDGSSTTCPTDAFQPATKVCRGSAGLCDVEETCSGNSAACPEDSYQPSTHTCRQAAGPCDVEEKCTGGSAACPDDAFLPATTTCRESAGICDVAEMCPGDGAACPNNVFVAKGTTCRSTAGQCDKEEVCTGDAPICPADTKMPNTTVCRAAVDLCDKAEYCTGSSDLCPTNEVLRDKAKAFKCGRTCYLCGIPTKSTNELVKLRNTYALDTCNMGSCDEYVFLESGHPQCTGPVSLTCPNNKGLSNIQHAVCNGLTGTWQCVLKQDSPFTGPVSPPW